MELTSWFRKDQGGDRTFFEASRWRVIEGREVEALDDDAVRSLPGAPGWVFYGPYVSAEAGIYWATTATRAVGGGPESLYWDVNASGRIYAGREFSAGSRIAVRLPDTTSLEFRFMTDGVEFVHRGVELQPVLLDRKPVSAPELEAVIRDLIAQEAETEATAYALERLALLDADAADRLRAELIASRAAPAGRMRALLVDVHTPTKNIRSRSPLALEALSRQDATAFIADQPLQLFNLPPQQDGVRRHDHKALQRLGYNPEYIAANRLLRSSQAPRRGWQTEAPAPGAPIEPKPPLTQALVNVDLSFQADLAEGRGMEAYCPISGQLLRSTHGFCEQVIGLPQTFYRFEGVEVFYVCTGGFINSRMFLYMPLTGTIVPIEEPGLRWYPFQDIIRAFNVSLLIHAEDVFAYLAGDVRYAAVFGLNNIGHFLWNDLSGLDFAVSQGLDKRLSEIVLVKEQYQDFRPLFPELAALTSTYVGDPHDVFGYFVRHRLCPIRFTDGVVEDTFFGRMRRAAAVERTSAGAPPPLSPRPLIWINLRAHNKIWVDQAAGYANILNALLEDYGSAAALLQGMPDCAELAAEVRRLTRPEVPLYDGLDLAPYDKISWAQEVDAYVCVTGAGLSLTTWFADKHGVAHAEHAHMGHLDYWPYVRPNAPPPLGPSLSDITELGVGVYCNYQVDWRILLDLLRQALRNAGRPPAD